MSDSTPTSDLEPPQNGQAENLKSENVQNVTEIPAEQQENPLFKGSWKPLKSSEITTEAKVEESYNSSNGKESPATGEVLAPDTSDESKSPVEDVSDENPVIPDSQPSISLLEISQEDEEPKKVENTPAEDQKEISKSEESRDEKSDTVTESAGAEVPMEEEPIEVKNATVCGTEDDKPVEAPKSPISVDFAEEEAKEMELTDSSPKEEKPKRGKGAPKSPTKAKKSFEESLLSGDEAPQPATPGRRGRSRDLSKTEETKPIETEAAEPVEATPETGKRPTRTRHPPKVENEVVVTPQRSLRTRGASASETLATTASVKDTPTKRKAESTPTPAKKQGKKGRKKQSDDPYDFDRESDSEKTPIGPLRHVSVARTSFGEVKFTKAPTPQPTAKGSKVTESSKYVNTSKAVEQRQQTVITTPASVKKARANADTLPLYDSDSEILTPSQPLYRVTIREEFVIEKINPNTNCVVKRAVAIRDKGTKLQATLTPDLKKQISPDDGPSAGAMADISSSSGSAATISQIGHVRYLDKPENVISKETPTAAKKKATPRRGRAKKTADVSLFSDVPMEEFQRDEDKSEESAGEESPDESVDKPAAASTTTPKPSTSAASTSSTRKRRTPAVTREPPPLLERSNKRRRTGSPGIERPTSPQYSLPATPAEQMSADFPEGSHATYMPGCRVMARWVDKNFYPGHVIYRDGLGRYKVRFIDGNFRDMPPADVMPVSQLKVEDKLMVWIKEFGADEELQPVKITKLPSTSDSDDWFGGIYQVENMTTEAVESVCWEKFVIDKEQTKNYIKTVVNKAAQDIVADNILSEKRERRSRISLSSELVSSTPPPPSPPLSKTPRAKAVKGAGSVTKAKTTPRAKTERKKMARKSTTTSDTEASESVSSSVQCSAPVAGEMPNLFEGKKFILTSANRRPVRTAEDSQTDTPEDERATVPFYKRQVRQMIEERGGVVVDDFSQEISIENCLLVADTHYRTHKYLSALARAVPCVSHMWIYSCCTEGQLLASKDFMLPAGYSLESKHTVPWHSECPTMLKGLTVFVFTTNQPANSTSLDFVQIWSPLVKCMGATVVTEMPPTGSSLDYVLTDASCPANVLSEAEAMGASAVSSEWLIQAIITGKKPDPKAHAKYKYDFVETTPSGAE